MHACMDGEKEEKDVCMDWGKQWKGKGRGKNII